MKIILVGGGEIGLALANMMGKEHKVTIVESDENFAKKLANKTNAMVIKGDGTDLSVLKESGIEETETLVATTDDDKTNLMICELAKTEKVKKIISLVNSPKNEQLFTKLGITSYIPIVGEIGVALRKALYEYGDEKIIAILGGGDLQLIKQMITKNSKLIGKPAQIESAVICSISRDDEYLMPNEDTILQEGDILIISVKSKDVASVVDLLSGK
jgi:trk system potassium uptake protein